MITESAIAKSLLFAVLCIGFSSSIASGKDPGFAFDIRRDVPIKALVSGHYSLTMDVGVLPVGANGILRLRLLNQDGSGFPIKEVISGCSCAKGTLSANNIKSGSFADLELIVNTPKVSDKIGSSLVVNLTSETDKSRDITLVIKYQLGGLMCFVDEIVVKELLPDESRLAFTVPLLLTKPIVASDVQLELSPATNGVLASLTEIDGTSVVNFIVDPIAVPDDGINLTLTAQVPDQGLLDQLLISLTHRQEIEISPRTLHFRQVDEKFTAQCILRVNDGSKEQKDSRLPSVEATVDGQRLDVEYTKVSKGVFLVNVSVKEPQAIQNIGKSFEEKIQWRVLTSEKSLDIKSKARFELSSAATSIVQP